MEPRPHRPLQTIDEDVLAAACRAGDRAALDRFCRTYTTRIERTIARLIGPTPDLEDLVQNTLIEALRSFALFRSEASLGTWVTRIAVHVAYRQLRRGVRRAVALELLPPSEEPVVAGRGADQVVSDRQLADALYALLDGIKPKKRIAFILYAIEGHSIEEIAALTGSSRAAVKSRIWFARRELLKKIAADARLCELAALLAGGAA